MPRWSLRLFSSTVLTTNGVSKLLNITETTFLVRSDTSGTYPREVLFPQSCHQSVFAKHAGFYATDERALWLHASKQQTMIAKRRVDMPPGVVAVNTYTCVCLNTTGERVKSGGMLALK